ncbi:MAG: hypothetical protein C0620_12035 [Desulfuromonas sp.]|nr:MAG: hypothetical protein C0620_12035 [Desulfuromonas sp.]
MVNSLRFFLANKITIQPIPPLLISSIAIMTEPTTIVDSFDKSGFCRITVDIAQQLQQVMI